MLRAELHDAVHSGTIGDLVFYRDRCGHGHSVLELGCGSGRIIGALAQTCPRACGLELDPQRLDLAQQRFAPVTQQGRLSFVHGDMRNFALDHRFDRILIPHGGLYCLLTEDDVIACLACAAAHLAPGGRILFDGYLADAFHRDSQPDDIDDDEFVPVKQVETHGRRWDVLERSRWNRGQQRIDACYVHIPHPAGAAIEIAMPQRYILSTQVPALLTAAGLRPIMIAQAFPHPPQEAALVVEADVAD